jgi:hypothetical protein
VEKTPSWQGGRWYSSWKEKKLFFNLLQQTWDSETWNINEKVAEYYIEAIKNVVPENMSGVILYNANETPSSFSNFLYGKGISSIHEQRSNSIKPFIDR